MSVAEVPDSEDEADDIASPSFKICLLVRQSGSGVITGDDDTGILRDLVTNSVTDDDG